MGFAEMPRGSGWLVVARVRCRLTTIHHIHNMLIARKRSLSLDSFDSEKRMAKRVCRQRPQLSPALGPKKANSCDTSQSLTPAVPLSTTPSTSSSSSTLASPSSQHSNGPEPLLLASSSSSSCSRSPSLSPASLSSSFTPPSSPPHAAADSSPPVVQKVPSSTTLGMLSTSSASDTSAEEARLKARYQDDFRRIWSGSVGILRSSGLFNLVVRLGLWTGSMKDCGRLTRVYPDLMRVLGRTVNTGDFHEISSHRELPFQYIVSVV